MSFHRMGEAETTVGAGEPRGARGWGLGLCETRFARQVAFETAHFEINLAIL